QETLGDLTTGDRLSPKVKVFLIPVIDQANNLLERLPVGSIYTWEDLTNHFLAQFFPPGRTSKLRNDILMFQQHQVSAAGTKVNAAGMKVTTAERLQLLEEFLLTEG
ncbi:zinc finger, CCHC-type containing protein, partial [Tanacetum coccineum]